MSKRISYSYLDPWIGPMLKSLYPRLRIPSRFPPEGIVGVGHLFAILGGIGFAFATHSWWGGMLAAVGILGNHTADCIDGTHARSTGQCRNGGELLDHFTDPISFTYWLIGIGYSVNRLDLSLVAVVCLLALAILVNIKAKLLGEFTLERFGPTEFKTLLLSFGLVLSGVFVFNPALVVSVSTWGLVLLVLTGLFQVPYRLVNAVREVNLRGDEPDNSEWVTN
jgi:phosphatidylglycerophosphate synthase